ncbi:hypothetical protein [Roseateles asaccharophilus]|uniref:Tetratricopeptide (TPR) repeat protein n=1 Tax=Roseateles asaccharophilus TaxID=582607 RepID=A0ABU2ADS5_9BURK|nr:hypothetical protein [Roseateles asaccharophilus]MDR7334158.1 tetratricopeptide (TPR) repeat protein [Roseateles asaccharophilus]
MPSKLISITRHAALIAALAVNTLPAQAQATARPAPSPAGCGEPFNVYGPFDYRLAHITQKSIVENAHFTRGVENLTRRKTGAFGHDIGYTLAVFPNHPRAIHSMEQLAAKEKTDPPQGADMTVECYYARGMNFVPDDLVFRMFYVNYLSRRNRLEEARRFLDYIVTQAGDAPHTHFNAGMLYFDLKVYDQALIQAHRAMALGMDRPDLRERLESVKRWKDPEPAPAADAAASAASAASQATR